VFPVGQKGDKKTMAMPVRERVLFIGGTARGTCDDTHAGRAARNREFLTTIMAAAAEPVRN
jgi:hypothetical protein